MSNSYCKTCDDSGEVCLDTVYTSDMMEIQDEPTKPCDDCPRCVVCEALCSDYPRSSGQLVDEWACMPAHAAQLLELDARDIVDGLVEGANLLQMKQRDRVEGDDVPVRDELLLSRALKILADEVIQEQIGRQRDLHVDIVSHCRDIVIEGEPQ